MHCRGLQALPMPASNMHMLDASLSVAPACLIDRLAHLPSLQIAMLSTDLRSLSLTSLHFVENNSPSFHKHSYKMFWILQYKLHMD